MESCPSGRRCSTRNAVCRNAPRVRIPNSPPEKGLASASPFSIKCACAREASRRPMKCLRAFAAHLTSLSAKQKTSLCRRHYFTCAKHKLHKQKSNREKLFKFHSSLQKHFISLSSACSLQLSVPDGTISALTRVKRACGS